MPCFRDPYALLIVAVVGLLHGTFSFAADPTRGATNVLTLGDALQLAHQRNIALRSVREEAAFARGQIVEARAGALPRVGLSAQYTRFDDVTRFEDFEMGQRDNYEAVAEFEQVLYAGGAVRAALRLAEEYGGVAEARIADACERTAYAVHVRFNQVLLARENLAVAEQAVELAEKNLTDVTAHLGQGMAKRFDLLRAEEQVSGGESDQIAAENAHRKARFALMRLLDLPLDDPRKVVGTLRSDCLPPDNRHAVSAALRRRQDLAAVEREVAVQRQAVAVAESGNRPTIAAFGHARHANPDRSFQDDWEGSWMVGVRAELPLFDGLKTRGKVRQARARLRQTELQRDDVAAQVRMEVAEATVDIVSAARVVSARQKSVEQAGEALRLAQRAYAEGVEQQINVIGAQSTLTASRFRLAVARFEHTMALRNLELATGSLVSENNDVTTPVGDTANRARKETH